VGEGVSIDVDALVEDIFQAYFVDARDISATEVLLGCAARSGMDENVVLLHLEGDEGYTAVTKWDKHAKRKLKVPSVPHFMFALEESSNFVTSGGEESMLSSALDQLLR